jgi:hypothetical protein
MRRPTPLGRDARRRPPVSPASFATFAELAAANKLDSPNGDPRRCSPRAQGAAGSASCASSSFTRLAQDYARDLSDPRLREADVVINQLPAGLFGFDRRAGRHPLILAAVMPLYAHPRLPPRPARVARAVPGYNAASYRTSRSSGSSTARPSAAGAVP